MDYSIGIDIGGTTIASGIINEKGDLIQQEVVDSDPSDPEKMFAQVVWSVEKLLAHSSIPFKDIEGIGAGVPGKVDRDRGIAIFQNNLPWEQFPFVDRLKERLSVERVVIDNDVDVAAFAEWNDADVGEDDLMVYMTVSTGIACSMIDGGRFIRGAGFSGELGLVPVLAPYETNRLGRLEEVAAGPAIEAYAREVLGQKTMSARQLFQDYYAGEAEAVSLIDHITDSLAHGVYIMGTLFDPHQIVFGGSVMTQNPVLLDVITNKLQHYIIAEQTHMLNNMKVSGLGYDRSIIGAGLLAMQPGIRPSTSR